MDLIIPRDLLAVSYRDFSRWQLYRGYRLARESAGFLAILIKNAKLKSLFGLMIVQCDQLMMWSPSKHPLRSRGSKLIGNFVFEPYLLLFENT